MKIGVQVLEDDYAPPARALSRRQLTLNIVGFDVAGDESPEIIRAVARGKIDVAVVWGPLAGYYAARQRVALDLRPVEPELDPPLQARSDSRIPECGVAPGGSTWHISRAVC